MLCGNRVAVVAILSEFKFVQLLKCPWNVKLADSKLACRLNLFECVLFSLVFV